MDVSSGTHVVSGSYLTNEVEAHYGREVSSRIARNDIIVKDTINYGCRLLTRDSTEKGNRTPYRWMSLRRVTWQEVARVHHSKGPAHSSARPIWHVVVHDMHLKSGAAVVPTAYFLTSMHLVFDMNREKFDFLTEDDPDIIRAAMSDTSYVQLLECYYRSGDQRDARRFLTLSTLTRVMQGKTLLHHCCENGLVECVKLLLAAYTPQTAEAGKPWLWLADPTLKEPHWSNTAFSIAVYRSDLPLFTALWDWAERADVLATHVRGFEDRKGFNLLAIARQRIENIAVQSSAAGQAGFAIEIYNLLAPVFDEAPMQSAQPAPTLATPACRVQSGACLRIDARDGDVPEAQRVGIGEPLLRELLPTQLRIAELAKLLETHDVQCGASVLVYGIELLSTGTFEEDLKAAHRCLRRLDHCTRVSVLKCLVSPALCIAWAIAVAACVRRGVGWRSARLPTFEPLGDDQASEDSSNGFADAMEDLADAVRETWADKSSELVDIDGGGPDGTGGFGCIPNARRRVLGRLSEQFRMKKVLFDLVKGACHWSRRDRGESEATNPFLHPVANIERRLLQKYRLTIGDVDCVEAALDSSWALQVEETVTTWLWQLVALPAWKHSCISKGFTRESDVQAACDKVAGLVDKAVIVFLRLRAARSHPGIDVVPALANAIASTDVSMILPNTMQYASNRRICIDKLKPLDMVAPRLGETPDSASDDDTPLIEIVVGQCDCTASIDKGKGAGKSISKGKGRGKGRGGRRL